MSNTARNLSLQGATRRFGLFGAAIRCAAGIAAASGCGHGPIERAAPAPTTTAEVPLWGEDNGWRCSSARQAPSATRANVPQLAPPQLGAGVDAGAEHATADAAAPIAPPKSKFVGNIARDEGPQSDFSCMWDQVTPENSGKWRSVEQERGKMNWAPLDRAYGYAREHGLVFKQHTLVWGSQFPSWLIDLPPAEQRIEVEEWIRSYCERYPDTELIDVVNEPPPHTTPPYVEALGGAGVSGYDWIVQAFMWADHYCPNSVLIFNDYNNIEFQSHHATFIDIVRRVLDAGAPIDALGAQAHAAYKRPLETVQGYLDALAAVGLPVYITEYDIDLEDDAAQLAVMQAQFPMFWHHPAVEGITLWGYVTGQTWRMHTGLLSPTHGPRPALVWLMDYLAQNAVP